ncbi:MAG: 30S ribosomal protein S21 [Planctomycetota bacterium]|nr:MAG: 30S ribosomal protein S21 [Planctomycetota bacterium]
MIKIVGRDNESLDSMIRRFKRLCRKEGVLIDLKKNQYYEKKSDIERHKKKAAIRRSQRKKN